MREDRIVQRVRELAERVRITGRSLQLEPMNSYERRLVHNAFKDDPEVATWSPSDSARIKQITLLKRQPKRETAPQGKAIASFCCSGALQALNFRPLVPLSAVGGRRYSLACERAASVPVPARTSGRQRNLFSSGLSFPSTASAMISPSTGRKFESMSAVTGGND